MENTKKTKAERHQISTIKIIMSICIAILMLNFVSADVSINPFADRKIVEPTITTDMSDFIKSDFNTDYGVIRLSKTFFWFETDKIAEYSLTKNTEKCSFFCEAEGKVTLFSDGILFDDVKFKTLKGQDTSIISSEYLILDGYKDNYVDVPDKQVCDNPLNKTDCSTTYVKVNQPIENWVKYGNEVLKAGDYRWKITGVKNAGDTIDFIPTRYDKEFSEWAIWSGDRIWYKNKTINASLPDTIGKPAPTIFKIDDWWYLIYGNDDGSFTGYTYDETSRVWVSNVTITKGLTDIGSNSAPFVFQKRDGYFYLISGSSVKANIPAFVWNTAGVTWVVNGTINKSIVGSSASVSSYAIPTIFYKDDFLYTIFGFENGQLGGMVYDEVTLSWAFNSTIVNNTGDLGDWVAPMVFNISNDYYMIVGEESLEWNGFWYNDTLKGWVANASIIRGLQTPDGWYAVPNIFLKDKFYYMIYGTSTGGGGAGDFRGFIYNLTDLTPPDQPPTIALTSPANETTFNTISVELKCTGKDDRIVENVSLYIDGAINYTLVDGVTNLTELTKTQNFLDGTYNWNCKVSDNATIPNTITGSSREFYIDTTPNITYIPPTLANDTIIYSNSFLVNVSVTETYFKNITFYLYKDNVFEISAGYDGSTRFFNFSNLADGTYQYNVTIWTTTGQSNSTITQTINLDLNPDLNVSLLYPTNNSFINSNYINFSVNLTFGDSTTFKNITIFIWNSTGGVQRKTTTIMDSTNITYTYIDNLKIGTYLWNAYACGTKFSTLCFWNATNSTLNLQGEVSANIYTNITYETQNEKFLLNYTLFPDSSLVSVRLIYNGTPYVVSDITNWAGNVVELKKSIDIPLNYEPYLFENKSFYWNFIITEEASSEYNTSSVNQTINQLNIVNCNATYPTLGLNFTTYDELTSDLINATFQSTWNYWMGLGTIKKNYSWEDTSLGNSSFKFCIHPNQSTIKTNLISSQTATGYFPRTYYLNNATINNITQEVSLKLINSSDGVKFFHTLRSGVARVADANVIISKFNVGTGNWMVIGIRQSDSQGEFIEYLELDKDYSYSITKSGEYLGTIEKTATCSATPCLVNLDLTSSSNLWDGWYDEFAPNVVYNLSYSSVTKNVTYQFVDTSGLATYFRLQVNQVNLNETGELYCDESLYAIVGTLKCDLTGEKGQFVARGYVARSPEKEVAIYYGILDALMQIIGKNEGLFFTLIMVLVVGLIGAFNPVVGILLAGVAFIFAGILGFIMMSVTAMLLVAFLIILLIIKMGRQGV